MKIDLYFDFVCPWCFIGHSYLIEQLNERPEDSFELNFKPFILAAQLEEPLDFQARMEQMFGNKEAKMNYFQTLTAKGKSAGLNINTDTIKKTGNTTLLHRIMNHLPAELKAKFLHTVFKFNFEQGQDIFSDETLALILKKIDSPELDIESFKKGDSQVREIEEENKKSWQMPILSVPFMMVNDKWPVQFLHIPGVLEAAFRNLSQ